MKISPRMRDMLISIWEWNDTGDRPDIPGGPTMAALKRRGLIEYSSYGRGSYCRTPLYSRVSITKTAQKILLKP